MLVFGAVMAFALLFSAMTTNLAERSVELATCAPPDSQTASRRMITAEKALVVAAGIVPGLLIGDVTAVPSWPLQHRLVSFHLHMRASTPVLAALAILLVACSPSTPGCAPSGALTSRASCVNDR